MWEILEQLSFDKEKIVQCICIGYLKIILQLIQKKKKEYLRLEGKSCLVRVTYILLDSLGNFIGPPRIWDQSGDGPGLMMSRSFGDQTGHRVGMICIPGSFE